MSNLTTAEHRLTNLAVRLGLTSRDLGVNETIGWDRIEKCPSPFSGQPGMYSAVGYPRQFGNGLGASWREAEATLREMAARNQERAA